MILCSAKRSLIGSYKNEDEIIVYKHVRRGVGLAGDSSICGRAVIIQGADKSLARPGRKEANISVRMAWISFGALPCKEKKNFMTAPVSMLL